MSSPAVGWRNEENVSFLARAGHSFDAVLMLAVIHHLQGHGWSAGFVDLDLAAEMTTDLLIVEYVPPDDPMFQLLARGRDALYKHLDVSFFEMTCRVRFDILRSQRLGASGRRLYVLEKKGPEVMVLSRDPAADQEHRDPDLCSRTCSSSLIWAELLIPRYYSYTISRVEYVAVLLNVLLLCSMFLILSRLLKSWPAFRRAGFIVLVMLAIWPVVKMLAPGRYMLDLFMPIGKYGLYAAVGSACILMIVAFVRWQSPLMNAARYLLLILLPFAALTIGQAGLHLCAPDTRFRLCRVPLLLKHAAKPDRPHGRPVAAILFDELDQRQAFAHRDKSVRMPEMDRFIRESLSATNAYSPGNMTQKSITSMFTGKPAAQASNHYGRRPDIRD